MESALCEAHNVLNGGRFFVASDMRIVIINGSGKERTLFSSENGTFKSECTLLTTIIRMNKPLNSYK